MEIDKLKQILKEFNSNVKFECDLKKKNWFNIGGKSNIFFSSKHFKRINTFS